ncbi:MAG: di-trans,poly-cis-decaprenylcistransferase [Myxococcales bacterium]|nr:di-trans,poly-cis-decaprenylcistransferase [Myxococcales bacterium]
MGSLPPWRAVGHGAATPFTPVLRPLAARGACACQRASVPPSLVSDTVIEARNLPRHIAIIMDGNGRWAEQRGLPRTEGHRRGSDAVRRVVRAARRLGVEALTLFAFSEQNWARPRLEVQLLMSLLREFLVSERGEILDNGIRLRAIGDLARLPPEVRGVLDPLANDSATNGAMTLTLALSYGGREEIADAAKDLARAVAAGQLDPEAITPELLQSRIASVAVGEPDLLVRTGGELRISNFLLWGAAYSELHFTPKLWPDFDADDLYRAVAAYQSRERRFGLTGAQVKVLRAGRADNESTIAPRAVQGLAQGAR